MEMRARHRDEFVQVLKPLANVLHAVVVERPGVGNVVHGASVHRQGWRIRAGRIANVQQSR
jgi:hypothetical protein